MTKSEIKRILNNESELQSACECVWDRRESDSPLVDFLIYKGIVPKLSMYRLVEYIEHVRRGLNELV